MLGANPQRTGYFDSEAITEKPKIKWKFKAAKKEWIYAKDGRYTIKSYGEIYNPIANNNAVYFGCSGGLYALNINNGKQIWRLQVNGDKSQAIYDSEIAYFATHDGVYAINAKTGKQKWFFKKKQNVYFEQPLSPLIYKNNIYINYSCNLYALDKKTGKEKWHLFENKSPCGVYSSPAISKGVIYVVLCKEWDLYAIDAITGNKIWGSSSSLPTTPVIINDTIYQSSIGTIMALDMSGKKIWSFNMPYKTSDLYPYVPAVKNNNVYAYSEQNRIYSVNRKTGKLARKIETDKQSIISSPIIAENTLYIVSGGHLFAFDTKTGKKLWKFKDDYIINSSSLFIHDKTIYVGAMDKNRDYYLLAIE